MSETKHEIPAPMLDAAAVAIEGLRTQTQLGLCSSEDIARVALEAAGVAELAARIAELGAELAKFQTSKFNPDWPLLQTTQESLRESWEQIRELEKQLHNAMTGEGCPHGCVRPSQCVDCIKERG